MSYRGCKQRTEQRLKEYKSRHLVSRSVTFKVQSMANVVILLRDDKKIAEGRRRQIPLSSLHDLKSSGSSNTCENSLTVSVMPGAFGCWSMGRQDADEKIRGFWEQIKMARGLTQTDTFWLERTSDRAQSSTGLDSRWLGSLLAQRNSRRLISGSGNQCNIQWTSEKRRRKCGTWEHRWLWKFSLFRRKLYCVN